MTRCRSSLVGSLSLAAVLGIGACSDPALDAEPVSTTASTAPASTTSGSTTSKAPEQLVIDLVTLGDSFVAWAEWPEMLAADLAAARDVEIVLDDSLAAPAVRARYEPDFLRNDPAAIDLVANAEVLILEPRPFMAPPAMSAFMSETCGGPTNSDCLAAAVVEMRAYVDDYLGLVVDIAPGDSEVVVVLVGSWPIDGAYPDLRATDPEKHEVLATFMLDLMRQTAESAIEHGIAVVDVGAIFNGPEYLDMALPELLGGDRIHLSEAGSRVVADAVAASLAAA
ncbi:MAG TPA: SGNH/GDSL hydrolase family protein [Acidimicrobiia bacterium]|nr:SGNH/GDSL hydrolase family protein [Acidimicrobiia bacterium]